MSVCSQCGEAKSDNEMRPPPSKQCWVCHRAYTRQYQAEKRKDPAWRERQCARVRKYQAEKRADPTWVERERARLHEYYVKKRADPTWVESGRARARERHAARLAADPEHSLKLALKQRGITDDEYTALVYSQNGGCAICRKGPHESGRRLVLDHCHTTGQMRGLLCHKCNVGLGHFEDNLDLFRRAAEYLRNYKEDEIRDVTREKK